MQGRRLRRSRGVRAARPCRRWSFVVSTASNHNIGGASSSSTSQESQWRRSLFNPCRSSGEDLHVYPERKEHVFRLDKKDIFEKKAPLSLQSSTPQTFCRGERSGTRRKGVVTEGAAEGASRRGGRQLRRIQSIALSHRPTAVTHCWCGISRSRYESAERSGEAATDASSGQPKASSRLCGVHRREGGSDRLGQRRRRRRRQRCCCW